jgi:hypothetical protein
MTNAPRKVVIALVTVFATIALSSFSLAQTEEQKADQTGTNPINFSKDFRVYDNYTWLNFGDGGANVLTAEYRTPFAGGKWQWRVRARYTGIEADLNNDGFDEIDQTGMGDIDMRFLTVLNMNMEKKTAWAAGLEVFLDTASEDVLGTGATAFGPQLFYVKFLQRGLFAPGLQYKFSVDEDLGRPKIDQILIDLNYLRMGADKQSWFFTDPQIIIDNETNTEFMIVDLEFGWMMSKWTELQGHSFYVRPSIGVGADRLTDYSVEIGYKVVGF